MAPGGATAYDVAIAGAGPAGVVAAFALARGGARVAICDRAVFPREKLCGGFLSGESVALLRSLDLERLFSPDERSVIDRFLLTSPAGASVQSPLPASAVAWGISRRILDERLIQAACKAGAEFLPATEALGPAEGGLLVRSRRAGSVPGGDRRLRAARVIAADGRDSRLARLPGRRSPASESPARAWGFQAFYSAPAMSARSVEIHFFRGGYIGLQPVGGGLFNACGLLHPEAAGALPADLDRLIEEISMRSSAVADRFHGARRESSWHTVGALRFGPRSPRLGEVLVAGDAAGSIEPFTGEGMSLAFATGLLAARTILEGGGAAAYAVRWRSVARTRLFACRALASLAARDRVRNAGLSLLARAPGLARSLVALTRTRGAAEAVR